MDVASSRARTMMQVKRPINVIRDTSPHNDESEGSPSQKSGKKLLISSQEEAQPGE